jgi:small-conductance mechanosensitive channel
VPAFGGILVYFQRLVAEAISSLGTPVVLAQIVTIAAVLFIALWLGPRFDRFVKRLALAAAPREWVIEIARLLSPISAALLVLFVLWAALVVANSIGLQFSLVRAAASLAAAWIVIRFATQMLNSPGWSIAVAIIAWSIAALSILGLLGAIAHQLDASAVNFGRFRLSALTAIRALFALAFLLWLTAIASDFLERRINRSASLTPPIRTALIQILRLLLPSLAVVGALAVVGIDLTALAVFSGAIGVGIGLGLQQTMSNFGAGLSLILGKTIQPGDVIGYEKSFGWVTQMGARYVSILTRDGKAHHIPNSHFITNGVENWSHFGNRVRLHIPLGIAYESDLRDVRRVLEKPEPVCLVSQFGESAIQLDLRIWIEDPPSGVSNVKSAVMLEIWDRFQREGIRFPFPQRDVHVIPASRDDAVEDGQESDRPGVLHS